MFGLLSTLWGLSYAISWQNISTAELVWEHYQSFLACCDAFQNLYLRGSVFLAVSPGPPKFGGWRSTPWIKGAAWAKSFVLQCFWGLPLHLGGESWHPKINLRGMGLQGGRWFFTCIVFWNLFWFAPIFVLIGFQNKSRKSPSGDTFGKSLTRYLILAFLSCHGCTRLSLLLFLRYRACVQWECELTKPSQVTRELGVWLTTHYKLSFAFMDSRRHMTLRSQQRCTFTKNIYSPLQIHVEDLGAEPARQQGYPQGSHGGPLPVCQGSLNQVRITSQLLCGIL